MKKEIKIGIFAILMIGCAWAGVRFLSGIDIFSRNVKYYAIYSDVNGLHSASPILIQGVKIGTITDISLDSKRNDGIVLELTINREYKIPKNSTAKIFSDGLMGAKAIGLTLGDAPQFLEKGDTIKSIHSPNIMDVAMLEFEHFKKEASAISFDLKNTLTNVNQLLETNAQSIEGLLANMNSITKTVDGILAEERENLKDAVAGLADFAQMLGDNSQRVDSIIYGVNRVVTQLEDENVMSHLAGAVAELNILMAQINSGDGSLGALLNDQKLYESLNSASGNLSYLLEDFKSNPKRYVHFSLFGASAEKEAKRAAKRVEKARQDSLKMLK